MTHLPNPNLDNLKSLSTALNAGIHNAQLEVKRSREQLDALQYSKSLVDESLSILTNNSGSAIQGMAHVTIFPSGSLALPICEHLLSLPPGGPRSNVCTQIQTTLQAGVSAFVSTVNLSPPQGMPNIDSLKQKLATHDAEIMSLEERLSIRLTEYSTHLVTILDGALNSFRDTGNALRYVNTGNGLRELHREFLAEVAPDDEVKKAPWFVPDKTSKNGVTRRHRIDYAIFKNLKQDQFPKAFAEQADATASSLLKDIGELSAYTHVTESILNKAYSDAAPLFASVMQQFLLLIAAIEGAKMLVEEDITTELQSHLDGVFTEDFFDELDCLSSHTRPQGASDIEILNVTFDEDTIRFDGSGSVDCDLQWGSDGDVRRGDGAESSASFPFKFSGKTPIGDPSQVKIERDSIIIDTSSFYGADDEDEGATG